MPAVRIFIIYTAGNSRESEMASRFIADVRASGAEVITAPEHLTGPGLSSFLDRTLSSCQYFVLVQTPASLDSPDIQTALQAAFTLLDRRHIIRFIVLPSENRDIPASWEMLQTFDASQDYPRMCDKVLIELGLIALDIEKTLGSLNTFQAPTQPAATVPALSRAPLREERTAPEPSPVPGPRLDRPARMRNRPAFLDFKGIAPSSAKVRSKPLVDRPTPRRATPGPIFLWGVALSFLAVGLILATSYFFTGKFPHVWAHPVGQRLQPTKPIAVLSPTHQPAPVRPTPTLLAQDTFQRADQAGWGVASDGQAWGTDAANGTFFSIQGGKGEITGGTGPLNATIGPHITDAEIFFTGSISLFNNSNLGAVLRWVNINTFYKAYINGQHLILLKDSGGKMTHLVGDLPFIATANTLYNLRFRVQGTTLSARVWPAGSPEPAQWMITAQDTTIQSGLGGVRVVNALGITITISAFQESSIA